ncbi:peptidoglycan DD-metalloendopeptidase family protein [Methylobacterium symbioticum]|jgi:murein DD-endopeptidase MepM/ murein hydrolase activator NlpD|uniref:Murein hydrolase activator NlpD n=1 Tax=Methylobacterium symbioticum TaxID=2584084 RepID=A0A509EGD1_9HYPH|nr:peptidoglycan DD-metalloendopeptidase family protein [Methylobacterium symbioticum]VUD72515.1 Murein hydrolase activator NlpD [Methylobacterium symbioticum]
MRGRGAGLGVRTLSRVALIGMIGGGTAACSSDTMRFGEPFSNPFASNLASEPAATGSLPDGELPPAPALRTGRIQSEALGAPAAPITPRSAPVASAPASARLSAPTRVASTGAAGWSSSGGTTIIVSQNDSLNQMSTRFGVPASAILQANGLTSASQVTPGRQLVIPVYNASGMNPAASPAPMSARTVPAAPSERVKAAEAKRQDEAKEAAKEAAKESARKAADAKREKEAEARRLAEKQAEEKARKEAALKEADKKKHVRPGQIAKADAKPDAKAEAKAEAKARAEAEAKLAKADAAKEAAKKLAEAKAAKANAEKAASAEKAAEKSSKTTAEKAAEKIAAEKKAEAKPEKVAAKAPEKAPEKPEPASTGSVAAPAAADQNFRWPAKGRVISGYGTSGNEGINIAVPEGTAVKAAEDGTVAYAGSDVKGYGKLVLVRHSNGYVSAYAHNGEIDVKPGEKVKRGQTIAKSGASGNVTSPQLHFEIRKGGAPVDPMSQLASN